MKPNLMILSTDSKFKNYLRTEFATKSILLNVDIPSILAVQNSIQANRANILILDVDTIPALPDSLTNLINNHKVHIIIVGIKNAASAITAGVRGTFTKPDPSNLFAHRILFRNLMDRIEMHTRHYSPAGSGDNNIATQSFGSSDAAEITDRVIAITASTGGTEALHSLLSALPAQMPPILVVQHMPSVFTFQFAERLNQSCKFTVKEALTKDVAKRNQALIAPGGLHMKTVRNGRKLAIECFNGNKVHGVIPAADILFNSMAEFMGKNVIGVVLTGMGVDGAQGLSNLKNKGATIIAQDKESSVVYGMPKAAVELGIVDHQLPLNKIADKIVSLM